MAMKLSTTLSHITSVPNSINSKIISEFYHSMKSIGTSENYQNQNLKAIIVYAKFLSSEITFYDIHKREQIATFLDTKIQTNDIDPDKKWITTWNDYLWRIKYFLRWFYNHKLVKDGGEEPPLPSDWITPFATIKKRKTKRLSPYLETELWDRDELLSIIKYEPYKCNKAALALLWDLDARPHEVTLLKIKHIRLRGVMVRAKFHMKPKLEQDLSFLFISICKRLAKRTFI
jgi:integrase/recombinase XerD